MEHGLWSTVVLGSSDRTAYIESLDLMRGLDFDVLVPWGSVAGELYVEFTSRRQARERVDAAIARVRAGGDR